MFEFDFSELEQFANNWERGINEFSQFLENFLIEQARKVLQEVKPRTPVDTGELQAAWKIGEIRISGNDLEVEIINDRDYASFVEFGHETRSGGFVNGRFMLTISLDEVRKNMPAEFHSQFKEWLEINGMA